MRKPNGIMASPCYPTHADVQGLLDMKYMASYFNEDYYRWAAIEKESGERIG